MASDIKEQFHSKGSHWVLRQTFVNLAPWFFQSLIRGIVSHISDALITQGCFDSVCFGNSSTAGSDTCASWPWPCALTLLMLRPRCRFSRAAHAERSEGSALTSPRCLGAGARGLAEAGVPPIPGPGMPSGAGA